MKSICSSRGIINPGTVVSKCSWMIQVQATGDLTEELNATLRAGVMFAGGTYACYRGNYTGPTGHRKPIGNHSKHHPKPEIPMSDPIGQCKGERKHSATHTQHSTHSHCYIHNHCTALSVLGYGPKAVSVICTENLVRGALNPCPSFPCIHTRTVLSIRTTCASPCHVLVGARIPFLGCACCYGRCTHFFIIRILHATLRHSLATYHAHCCRASA